MIFLPYLDVSWKIVITFAVKKQYKRHLTRRLFGVQVAGIVLLLLFLLYEFHHIEYLPISHFAFEFNYLSFIFHLINTEIEWVVSSLFNSSAKGIRKPLLKFCCCFYHMGDFWVAHGFSCGLGEELFSNSDSVFFRSLDRCSFGT